MYPVFPFLIIRTLDKNVAGAHVFVIQDNGSVQEGTLTRTVTNGRDIKNGDKVRLDCTHAIELKPPTHPLGKMCDLVFPKNESDRFSIVIDQSGVPDKAVLIYR